MSLKILCDAFEAMERAQTSDELRVQMERFAREMGFEHFAYALTVKVPSLKAQQHYINGFPDGWVERYLKSGYFGVDPIVKHAESSAMPAVWTDDKFHDKQSQDFWEDARQYGLKEGLSFAVHEQPGVTGIFSLARDQVLDLEGQDLAALVGRAQMFASLLHHAVARIDLPKLLPGQATPLTDRERECLKWTADGKTAWEIGRILSIAERTVVFHINNVVQKLGAANKTQALVRAVALRLV
jgi:LuxR family transcriptional regulator, quorum-sensing system regulator SolR